MFRRKKPCQFVKHMGVRSNTSKFLEHTHTYSEITTKFSVKKRRDALEKLRELDCGSLTDIIIQWHVIDDRYDWCI